MKHPCSIPLALLPILLLPFFATNSHSKGADLSLLPRENLLLFHDGKGGTKPVTTKQHWRKRRAEIVQAFHGVAGDFPVGKRLSLPRVSIQSEVDCGAYVRRALTFESEPGCDVPAYLLIPKGALTGAGAYPAILALHPTDMEYGHRVVVEQMRTHYRAYAHDLAELGFVVLAPAYPLMGAYHPDLKALGYASGTLKAVWDNKRALDLLDSLPFVQRGSYGAIGHSLGGHNALFTALVEPRIKAVVSSCGFDSFIEYMDGKIEGWCGERYMPRLRHYSGRLNEVPFDFHEVLAALAPRRVWVSAPMGDTNFKWKSVDAIARAAFPVYALHKAPSALTIEHPDCGHDFPEPSRRRAYAFLTRELKNPPEPASTPTTQLPKITLKKKSQSFLAGRTPYAPFGVNYYRPGTGWAPQVWKQFDLEATRSDFARMKSLGVNCVRVFLTYGSFYSESGILNEDGLRKFDQLLDLAEQAGIYVHPTGPDHWEGMPAWKPVSIEDETTLTALEYFWRVFAARYRGRSAIFAYDLKNEPEVPWDTPTLRRKWSAWLHKRYASPDRLASAWQTNAIGSFDSVLPPSGTDAPLKRSLLDYQEFREDIADEWTSRQVNAIRSVDPDALVTVGLIQWSVPAVLPGLKHYSGFRPARQAPFLDFMEVHFYPLANGAYEYSGQAEEEANLAYLESVVREVADVGKPVVLAEFGWYGGGKPKFDGGRRPAATGQQQARYCRRVVETTAGHVVGWLNWGFYDQPEATDVSELTGLLTSTGAMKEWGTTFAGLSRRYTGKPLNRPETGPRPPMDWNACLTSSAAAARFRSEYLRAWQNDASRRD